MDQQSTPGVPRPVLIVAITLATLLAVGVAGIGLHSKYVAGKEREAEQARLEARRTGPLALPPVPAPEAGSPECATVLAALPRELVVNGDPVPRREIAEPAPQGAVAWGDAQHDTITLRCGIDAPAELTPASELAEISGVSWFEVVEGGKSSWLAVDRPVRVALTVPDGSGTGPVQDMSKLLGEKLPEQPVFG
ncbi:DUF3515 domain-containing protein [Parasphingorhabdus pacifica]